MGKFVLLLRGFHLCLLQDQLDFQLRFRICFSYIVFTTCVNRLLTLYITIKRTQCVLNIDAAENMRAQSTKDNLTHILKYGVSPGVSLFIILTPIPNALAATEIISPESAEKFFWGLSVVFFGFLALAMTAMGTTIVTKIKV